MGLFTTKNIVEKHGGKIWFESKDGEGTTFFFTVPVFK
jgi:signal transduction histidine kinase